MLVEAYASINYTMMYYSQQTPRAHMPFNFNFITYLKKTSSAVDIKNTINLWLDNMPPGQWANWVVGNDQYLILIKYIQFKFNEVIAKLI